MVDIISCEQLSPFFCNYTTPTTPAIYLVAEHLEDTVSVIFLLKLFGEATLSLYSSCKALIQALNDFAHRRTLCRVLCSLGHMIMLYCLDSVGKCLTQSKSLFMSVDFDQVGFCQRISQRTSPKRHTSLLIVCTVKQ